MFEKNLKFSKYLEAMIKKIKGKDDLSVFSSF